jgi:hypothetical protein
MASASRRKLILEEFRARVSAITIANGFFTDAGKNVFLGEVPTLGPDDAETAIALVVEEDDPNTQTPFGPGTGATIQIGLTIAIHALAMADLDTPLLAIEDVIHDIKQAVELDDRTLGGLVGSLMRGPTRPLDREEGSTVVGASVDYDVMYSEAWGDPEA